ncbi:hypothetical protein BD626DRAFT_633104 [Schizophyllum amplum]|uniref:MYND-type domain-containing protein n=1 Tax=Schizophyllum amplum TaxID=97359 RepID=A0A550C437_9AGAR|nr:hypothetical protein BD626DRAFT_633104 [Auriculariopsis ampla]
MGESHQFFLIARIEPHGGGKAQYRCIGALNAQWYHGSMPVSAARRLIQLLRVPDNAQIVQEELRAIAGNYGAHGATEPVIPARPCPYTLFLANLAGGRACGSGVWSHGHSCTAIADVGARVYRVAGGRVIARIIAAGPEIEEDENFDEDMRYFRELATFRDDVPMIEPEALSQAWPQSLAPLVPEDASAGSEDMVVEAGDLSGIAPLLDQPDKLPRIRDALREISPFPDTGIPVLQELVARLLDGKPVDVLDLSGNATLDVDGLRDLLVRVPSIRRLVLFRTGVPSDALLALLHTKPALFYRISELVHPALLSWPFKTPKEWTTAFAIEAVTPGWRCRVRRREDPHAVACAAAAWPHALHARGHGEGQRVRPGAGDAVLEAAITGGAGGDWDSRSVWCTPMPARGALIHSLLGGGAPPPPPNFAPMYGFIHETNRDGWLAKGRRWEMLDARGFLRELAPFTGLLSYAGGFFGTTRQGEGRTALPEEEGLPALPEDIEREFLAVFDEAGRRSGLLDLAKYHEMSFNLHMNQEQRRTPRYVSSRIHYALAHLLPARLYNCFWPPPPPPDGYIIIDPRTGKCTLIVFEKGRPHEDEAEEDGYVWEEQEPEVEEVRCQRCKRKGVERRRKPAYCARCNAPYCGQKCRKADNRAHGRKCRG